ncbi:MAG: hypothetical protein BroJett022_21390 [Actinomycetes bacterium]|nr:MAG: hypothetical protein BroJett022_21390 [Actinomycetes bacterium]
MAARVAVFLDYQNVYMGARSAFHAHGTAHQDGQIDPCRLAKLLVSKGPPDVDRELSEVRIYRGQPDPQKDPRGYAANDRQCNHWRTLPNTTVITQTLRYPYGWPREKEQEKGIDVKLAIDLVAGAVRRDYEVAILMSTDTDLKPALEFVRDLEGRPYPRCEVAAWSSSDSYSRRLSIPGRQIWCHWLVESDYRSVADPTNYAEPLE